MVSQIDFIASFAKLLDVNLDANEAPDSRDSLAAFIGEDEYGLPFMPKESPGATALRKGNWKYIEFRKHSWGHKKGNKKELYDLTSDIGEKNNLIDQYPEIAKEMADLLKKIKDDGRIR